MGYSCYDTAALFCCRTLSAQANFISQRLLHSGHQFDDLLYICSYFQIQPTMEATHQEKSFPKMIRKPRTITESSSSSDTSSSFSFSSTSSSADMMEAMDRIALEWGHEEETEEEFELRRRLEFAQ